MKRPASTSVVKLAANDPSDDPLSISYIRFLRIIMSVIGAWPQEAFTDRNHTLLYCSSICVGSITMVGQIIYLKENYKRLPFFDMSRIYMTLFFSTLAAIRAFLPLFRAYGLLMKEFLMTFHLVHFKHKGGYYQEIYAKLERLSYRAVVVLISSALSCTLSFNMIPIVNNLRSGAYYDQNMTTELAVYYSFYHFNDQDHIGIVTAYNLFVVTLCFLLTFTIDSVMFIIIFQIIGHTDILKYNLTQFPKPESGGIQTAQRGPSRPSYVAVAMLNDQQNLIFAEKIKQCVQHHIFIVQFSDKVSAFFGPILAIYYVFFLVTGCLMLLGLSTGDAASIIQYGPVTVGMFALLIILSTVFELVKTKSESLVDALYSQAWESASVPNQRSVCVMLHRLQTPIEVRALGVTPVNLETMVKIVKTSFSYLALLKTLDT